MKTIVILRFASGADFSDLENLIPNEERAVWEHLISGELREISYNLSSFGSVVLTFETPSTDRARELVEALPLVVKGLLIPEYLPLKPYDGLANLFDRALKIGQQPPIEWQKLAPPQQV